MIKYFKKVNRNDRAAMVAYLVDHDDHGGCFSNVIKVDHLGLTPDQRKLLTPFFELGDFFYRTLDVMLTNLGSERFLHVKRCGRSGGHLELWSCLSRPTIVYSGNASDYLTMPFPDLRDTVQQVQAFDQLCDKFLVAVLNFCQHHEIVEAEQMVRQTVKVIRDRT
jgi:hypothetical protein